MTTTAEKAEQVGRLFEKYGIPAAILGHPVEHYLNDLLDWAGAVAGHGYDEERARVAIMCHNGRDGEDAAVHTAVVPPEALIAILMMARGDSDA